MYLSTPLEDIRAFHFDDWGKLLSSDRVRLLGNRLLHNDPPAAVSGFQTLRDLIDYAKQAEAQQHTLGQLIEALEACGYRHVVIEINKSLSPAASTPDLGIEIPLDIRTSEARGNRMLFSGTSSQLATSFASHFNHPFSSTSTTAPQTSFENYFSQLVQRMYSDRSLTTLCADNFGLTLQSVKEIAGALAMNSSITYLSLAINNLNSKAAKFLTKALSCNRTLTGLNLSRNALKKEGANHIAKVLLHNSILTSLDLSFNDLKTEGISRIADALFDNYTLTQLNLESNNSTGKILFRVISEKLEQNKRRTLTHSSAIPSSSSFRAGENTLPQDLLSQAPDYPPGSLFRSVPSLTPSSLQSLPRAFDDAHRDTLRLTSAEALKLARLREQIESLKFLRSLPISFVCPVNFPFITASSSQFELEQELEQNKRLHAEAAVKLQAELNSNELVVQQALKQAKRLQAELEALKAKQHNDTPQQLGREGKARDFLSRLLIRTLDELEVEEAHFAKGAFGNVHRGRYHGQPVAVKRFERLPDLATLEKELKMWSLLMHPNIVQLMGYTEPPLAPMIVMELMDGSLFDVLRNKDISLTLLRRLQISHDLASGVSYLHHHQGVHRDIKSLNVLVKGNDVKLADFGGTRSLMDVRSTSAVGTIRWNAPEMLDGEEASQASDVYAMGITFSEILTREIPYAYLKADGAVVRAVFSGIRPQLWPPTNEMQELIAEGNLEQQTEGYRQLIQRCWEMAPERRPSAREVRLELASLMNQLQHLAQSPAAIAASSSQEPVRSIPPPFYSLDS